MTNKDRELVNIKNKEKETTSQEAESDRKSLIPPLLAITNQSLKVNYIKNHPRITILTIIIEVKPD